MRSRDLAAIDVARCNDSLNVLAGGSKPYDVSGTGSPAILDGGVNL